MSVVKISKKGWVVIPAELRRRYGWKPGDRIRVVDYGGLVSLVPVLQNPEEEGWGSSKVPGRSLLEGLKAARTEERLRERSASSVIVLDTWAMLAYLQAEPAAREVRQALRRARRNEISVFLSIINFGECLYVIERKQGVERALREANVIDQLALAVVPADRPLVFQAAHMKARYPISYADAFSAALAKRYSGRLMTGDPEFKTVEPEVAIHWLPTRRR